MISRRKIFGWLASLATGTMAAPTLVQAKWHATVDAGMFAHFPGILYPRGSQGLNAPTSEIEISAGKYEKLRRWFRDNPQALWAPDTRPPCEAIREQAIKLSEPFAKANPLVEYGAWVDCCTDNVLLKTYRLDRKITGVALALGAAITRQAMRDEGNLDAYIEEMWTVLTAAINGEPVPAVWEPKIASLARLKLEGV